MADYWAKIYIEIIDDPKMATMPDRLWRRTIELFLLAKKMNAGGHLPETKQLAWLLRMSTDELDLDMKQIASTGIVKAETGGWLVVNFEKRQAAATGTERSQQSRKREQQKQYYNSDATQLQRFVAQSTETKTDTETETETKDDKALIAGELAPLAEAVRIATKLPDFTPNPKSYIQALTDMHKSGVIPADIAAAAMALRTGKYIIIGAQSLVNTAISEMGRRLAVNTVPVHEHREVY